jgi:uncharacterized caspase-like protein
LRRPQFETLELLWFTCLIVFAATFLVSLPGAAAAQKRVALVVGNSDYRFLHQLGNPRYDAVDIADALRDLGFEVGEPALDLGRADLEAEIARFADEAADADVALLYYAGHGIQLSARNFLIPVDARLDSEDDIRRAGIDLDLVIRKLKNGHGARLIVLDSCRNNPMGEALENGLAPPVLPAGFLVAYSAEPNGVAFDGSGRNSPFAKAFLSYLASRGEDINSVLVSVRKDVVADTGGKQIPQDWSSLTGKVVLAPGERSPFTTETTLWQLAGGGPDADLLRVYLERYPDGPHAVDAHRQLAEAVPTGRASRSATRNVRAEVEQPEELLWALARNSRMRPLVELYLARYPDGAEADSARKLLLALPTSDDPNASPDTLCARLTTHPNDATADVGGVSLAELVHNRERAILACRAAVASYPDNPHYVALLARAIAAGRQPGQPIPVEAIDLYKQAAGRGDGRAMQTLARLMQTGDSVQKDLKGAMALYQRAADRGIADAAVNLAVALYKGAGIAKNIRRAVELLSTASANGSGMATYNLAVFHDEGVVGTRTESLDLFARAAEQGETRAYVAAAKLLDEGRGVKRDPAEAGRYLLAGVATDPGDAMNEILEHSEAWSPETIRSIQKELWKAGYYRGEAETKGGTRLASALQQWRLLGPPAQEGAAWQP